jgi:hypothetical protein
VIGSLLYRLGGLLILGDIVYLVVWQGAMGGADNHLFRTILGAAAVCLLGGLLMSLLSRAHSGITVPTCPRCGRKVARGRVYCDDHLKETINRYRDEQREKGA